MKPSSPEIWAAALVKTQGHNAAARIALIEARPLYGKNIENQTVNPNAPYFKHAYNWIKNRYKVTAKTSENQMPSGEGTIK